MNAILIGVEGRQKMLTALMGQVRRPGAQSVEVTAPLPPPENNRLPPLVPKAFDAMFADAGKKRYGKVITVGQHNRKG